MFRSYYMTFSGEYRGGAEPHGHGHGDEHGHAHTPHESPWTITVVLVALAAGSVATLFLGIPALWSGTSPVFERWLEPVLATVRFREAGPGAEWLLEGLGVAAALAGWLGARALYLDGHSRVPALLKERFAWAWNVVYQKYYVDELYDFLWVRPAVRLAGALSFFDKRVIDALVELVAAAVRLLARLDGAIDRYLVDGAVNAVADGTAGLGRSLRRLQTGHIQTYLYGALGGALVVVLLNFLIR
jgi:NADH-quinone oxidoreductase subunit L